MPSEAKKSDPVPSPQGSWEAFRWEGGDRYRIVGEDTLREKTVMELVNGPYVICFDTKTEGRIYFVGYNEELWQQLTTEGKTVKGLWDLFEGIRRDIIAKGLPHETSIYRWSISQVWAHQASLEVFPGSKVEVRE